MKLDLNYYLNSLFPLSNLLHFPEKKKTLVRFLKKILRKYLTSQYGCWPSVKFIIPPYTLGWLVIKHRITLYSHNAVLMSYLPKNNFYTKRKSFYTCHFSYTQLFFLFLIIHLPPSLKMQCYMISGVSYAFKKLEFLYNHFLLTFYYTEKLLRLVFSQENPLAVFTTVLSWVFYCWFFFKKSSLGFFTTALSTVLLHFLMSTTTYVLTGIY